jgi:hypothetical protein
MPQSLKESSLNRIFSVFAIPENPMGEPKDGIPMRHHKAAKGSCIAGSRTQQQVRLLVCQVWRSSSCFLYVWIRA